MFKLAFFSAKKYDQFFFNEANSFTDPQVEITYFETQLNAHTAPLAHGFSALCAFVNDQLDGEVLQLLHKGGTRLIALRSAGYNHCDLTAAVKLGLSVVRVPEYSPFAVAEHTLALILTLSRKTHKAYNRVREGNFSLEGLLGFELQDKTLGVVGTGKIGKAVIKIFTALTKNIIAYDIAPDPKIISDKVQYSSLQELFQNSDIITLHCPLTPQTKHLINQKNLAQMRPKAMLINTGRGGLIDTRSVISALKSEHLGYLGIDVYEEENALFFEDNSNQIIQDDIFARLMTFPNVLITGHQAFFTEKALRELATTTLQSCRQFSKGLNLTYQIK